MMWHTILFCFLSSIALVSSEGDIGPGIWNVKSVSKCADDALFNIKFDVRKSKVNRTCDAYSCGMIFDQDIDENYPVRIEVCKHCDGGCKPYQVIADDSLPRLITKYAEGNFADAMALSNIESQGFPIPAGEYEVKDFVLNYCELPPEAVYGEFDAEVYLLKDQREVACLIASVEFVTDDDCKCRDPSECE